MTSYHDLEQNTYNVVRANPFTQIHGKPTWRTKEVLKDEAAQLATRFKVSYNWSGNYGLLGLIVGATRLAADYPTLAPFVQPTQPPQLPNYPNANPSGTQ